MHLEEFKGLVSAHKNRLYRLANWMLHNTEDAEDLIQEVFLKLWSIKHDLDKYRSLEGLLVQMTKNMCLNKIKSRKIDGSDLWLETLQSTQVLPDGLIEQNENLQLVKRVMQKLPDQQQVVLQLRAVEGLETREIAKIVDETENNVRVLLSRARKNVRESFQNYFSHG
jgi:RNA polymerase sigma-70 factor (ECF subfamily)